MANKVLVIPGGAGKSLVGQRTALGFIGQLRIDVREEITHAVHAEDDRSVYIEVDYPIGTTPKLLADLEKQVGETITHPAHMAHAQLLCQYWPGDELLKDGLAASPAVGGAAISQRANALALNNALKKIVFEWAHNVGPTNPLELWFVRSKCGGMGAGAGRFVAQQFVDLLATVGGAKVLMNFIEIGPLTYKPIEELRTSLNTFVGIAADAAFRTRLALEYRDRIAVSTRWYYVEMPYVGKGPQAVPVRATLVETAAKAIMIDELQEAMKKIVVNDGVGLVRTGFWSYDFDEKLKYYETLRTLDEKLNALIQPDYGMVVTDKPKPQFSYGKDLEDVIAKMGRPQFLLEQMERGWRFPKLPHIGSLTRDQLDRLVGTWVASINRLVHPTKIERIDARYQVQDLRTVDGEEKVTTTDLSIPITERSVDQFDFDAVNDIHLALAWCRHLLDIDDQRVGTKGLVDELLQLGDKCSRAQHRRTLFAGTNVRADELAQYLPDFVEALVRARYLMTLEKQASHALTFELIRPREVLAFVQRELEANMPEMGKPSPVIAAELSDVLDRATGHSWLVLLHRSVRRGDAEGFRSGALKGAAGLTQDGLLTVLGLAPNADVSDMRTELRSRVGRMRDNDGNEFEGQWWNASRPPRTPDYRYRVLPKLDPKTRVVLGDRDREIAYKYADLGAIGLSVLAVEATSIAPKDDIVATPAYLLEGLIPLVKEVLKDWRTPSFGRPSGKLALAKAGVVGEPLFEPALREAGLNDSEIEKLAELYEMYDP